MTTERYQLPFFERENSRYDIVPTLGTNALLISYSVVQTNLHAKGVIVPMVGMIV